MARKDLLTRRQNLGGAPKGNVNAMSCGAYSRRLLSEDEHRLFETLRNNLQSDFPSANQSTLEEITMCYVQMLRAIDAGNDDALQRLSRKMRKHLNVVMNPTENRDRSGCSITYDEWLDSLSKTMK